MRLSTRNIPGFRAGAEPRQQCVVGFLSTIEIASLTPNAQAVFLSACETAKGKLVKLVGIRDTARAFLLAGAQSVVATQWSVRDDAAAVLASTFYDRLYRGLAAPGIA